MRRGDIVLADLEPTRGSEANKRRPVIIAGNQPSIDAALRHGRGVITVVPVTSNPQVRGPMHVPLRASRLNGLRVASKAQVEQVRSIDVERLGSVLGRLGPSDIDQLNDALRYHLAV